MWPRSLNKHIKNIIEFFALVRNKNTNNAIGYIIIDLIHFYSGHLDQTNKNARYTVYQAKEERSSENTTFRRC